VGLVPPDHVDAGNAVVSAAEEVLRYEPAGSGSPRLPIGFAAPR
jgi:hypothetical protein